VPPRLARMAGKAMAVTDESINPMAEAITAAANK